MSNIYKVTLKGQPGALYVSYHNERLKECLFMFEPFLTPQSRGLLSSFFPYEESELETLRQKTAFDYNLLVPRNASDKLAMFCMTFRNHRNQPYTPKKNEKANMTDVSVTQQLLDVYFSNTEFPLTYAKSISDYIKNYNYIRDIAANGKPDKNRFPDVYDREYERTLDADRLSLYWQHLNRQGWKKADGVWTKH
jgi:hypothetical protein